jgi:hypothetical protein
MSTIESKLIMAYLLVPHPYRLTHSGTQSAFNCELKKLEKNVANELERLVLSSWGRGSRARALVNVNNITVHLSI